MEINETETILEIETINIIECPVCGLDKISVMNREPIYD